MCWFPLRPWRLRIARGDFEHVVRCGECPGCLEFERRRLADRLSQRYSTGPVQPAESSTTGATTPASSAAATDTRLFLVRIQAPLKEHAALSHSLHRRKKLELEPGFFRLGVHAIGLLVRNPLPIRKALSRRAIEHRIEPILFRRRRRAWRSITAGLAVHRQHYGEQTKRFYARGLPPAERLKWEVLKRGYGKGYQRAESPRAWQHRTGLILVPPELWRMRALDRSVLRRAVRFAGDPESAERVLGLVAKVARNKACNMVSQNAPEAPPKSPRDHTPPPGGGGYVSSRHSSGDATPKTAADDPLTAIGEAGIPLWMERERAQHEAQKQRQDERSGRARRELAEALERLRLAIKRRFPDGR